MISNQLSNDYDYFELQEKLESVCDQSTNISQNTHSVVKYKDSVGIVNRKQKAADDYVTTPEPTEKKLQFSKPSSSHRTFLQQQLDDLVLQYVVDSLISLTNSR